MTMKEPNFAAFLTSFDFGSGNLAHDYILTPDKLVKNRFLDTVSNTLTAFQRPIGETFLVMEDDLAGKYRKYAKTNAYPPLPYIRDGKLFYRNEIYDKMIMCPLLMDFSQSEEDLEYIYYAFTAEDKITPYIEDTIAGMRLYYEKSQYHLFEFYPFVGINPRVHSLSFLEHLLEAYVNTSHTMHDSAVVEEKPFYGIKLYPPLGTDPWPQDNAELVKMRTLYAFCQKNRIPIITHCDDQGFRGVSPKLSWEYTNPATWRTVLENYPDLIIDFAHVGKQYSIANFNPLFAFQSRLKNMPTSEWFYEIMKLIQDFPSIYSDISFSGCVDGFHEGLWNYLSSEASKESAEKIKEHLLFGSDFSINLLKIESYSAYYFKTENSVFSDRFLSLMVSENPIKFLGLKEKAIAAPKKLRIPFLKK